MSFYAVGNTMKEVRASLFLSVTLLFILSFFVCSVYAAEANERRLKITLDGKQVLTATLLESLATEEFLTKLPFTFEMHEHLNRQKEIYLPFKLSDSNVQNLRYEYAVGDIAYWHPGPTMGIFHSHDGRRINAGVEILARLDAEGVKAFASYPDKVSVRMELEGAQDVKASDERQLIITLDKTRAITATLIESPLTEEFLTHLPLTLHMTDYLKREKHANLSFSIKEQNLTKVQQPYEIGDVIYYPPGPTFAMYYNHDGRVISAGMEVLASLTPDSIKTLSEFPGAVEVTIDLAK